MKSKITIAREKVGISRYKVAKELEIPYKTILNWESGERQPAPWAEKLIIEKIERMLSSEDDKVYKKILSLADKEYMHNGLIVLYGYKKNVINFVKELNVIVHEVPIEDAYYKVFKIQIGAKKMYLCCENETTNNQCDYRVYITENAPEDSWEMMITDVLGQINRLEYN